MMRLLVAGTALTIAAAGCRSSRSKPTLEPFEIRLTPTADTYPDVDAVVLIDRGALTFLPNPRGGPPVARLRHHRRLKVLRASSGAFAVRLRHPPASAIRDLVARVVTPEGDAQTLPSTVGLTTEFDPRHRRFEVLRFPNAANGCVVEYAYDLYLKDARFIEPWVFSGPYPVVRSEFAVVVPPSIEVELRYSIDGAFAQHPPERFDDPDGTRYFWAENNLSALFPEPDMPEPSLTAPRAHVFFLRWRNKGAHFDGFASWDDVRAWLDPPSADIQDRTDLRATTAVRWAGDGDTETRALRLFETITSAIVDDPVESMQTADRPAAERILRDSRANVFARGELLTKMLIDAGIPATRALVARRNHDMLLADVPNPLAVDSLVAVVSVGPKRQLVLDPSFRTAGPVPPGLLQGTRMIVLDREGTRIEPIPASKPEESGCRIRYDLTMTTTGDLEGHMNATCFGALAARLLDRLGPTRTEAATEASLDERVAAFLRAEGAIYPIESVTVSTPNTPGAPLVVHAEIQRNAVTHDDNDGMRIDMSAFMGGPETSLREVRRTPRIFVAPSESEIDVELAVPLSASITATPEAAQERWPMGAMTLEINAVTPHHLSIRRTITQTALEVPAVEWSTYRDFVRRVLHRSSQPVLIETTL